MRPKDQRPGISHCPEKLVIIQATSACVLYMLKGASVLKTQDLTFTSVSAVTDDIG